MKKILLFLFTLSYLPYLGNTQTLGNDKIISANANNSVSKNVLIDSITAYDARNLGNQSSIGTANDTILTTLNGAVRKVKAGTIIGNNQTFIANSTADTLLGVNGNVQTKLNSYQNNVTGEREAMSVSSNNNFIYDAVAYSGASNDTGAIVLEFPIGADNHMISAEIDGYSYANSNNVYKLKIGFYNSTPSLIQFSGGGSVTGQFNRQVRVGYVNNHICIIIGDTTDIWSYPKVNLSKTTLAYTAPVQMINGWASRISKTFVGYTQLTPIPLNSSLTANADTANLVLQSVSAPSSYFTKLTNQYNSLEPFILQNGSAKILGSKTINSVGSTYLNSQYDLNLSTGTSDPTASSVKMVVKQNGNVGIGTTSPSYLLDVSADSRFNGVRVGTGGGNIASNTVVGNSAGISNTTGYQNAFLGVQAGYNNSTGNSNSFIGLQAGYGNTTGSNNSFLGNYAGYNNTGSNNSFIGYAAGYSNTGSNNSFLGFQAGFSNTGYNNSFLGFQAGFSNTSGYNNSFLGNYAGYNNLTGSNNSFLGLQAGQSNTTGNNNLYLGYNAGGTNISGSSNTYLGVTSTGVTNGSSRSNMLAIGTYSNGTYIFGDSTGAIGIGTTTPAYKLDVTADSRFNGVVVGRGAGNQASNTVVGNNSGVSNTTGYQNAFLGVQAGYNNSTGNSNSFIGLQAGYGNTTGSNNSFLGNYAGYNNTGSNNSFIGYAAGYSNTGSNNSFLGFQAGFSNTGYNNSFLGFQAGFSNTSGYNNSFLGNYAGYNNLTGSNNSFLGLQAGQSNTTGNNNLYLGYNAGGTNISGSSNTYLGVTSTGVTNGSSRSNMLAIGTYSNGTYIFGDSTGAIGIGTTTPAYKLDVNGTARFAGNIGIGGASPNAPLQFANIVANRKVVLYDANNNDYQFYGLGISGGTMRYNIQDISANHVFYTGTSSTTSAELMRIQGNGNVGIGTASPSYLLDVTADSRFNGVLVGRGAGNIASNTAVGNNAGYSNTSGVSNSFLGFQAGYSNSTGNNNTCVGRTAGTYNVSGGNNTFVGNLSGWNSLGSGNTFLGQNSGNASTASYNTFLGYSSGNSVISGNGNTYLGVQATGVTNEASRSNMLAIGSQINGVYIVGDSTGAIGIGTLVPSYKLDVNSTSNPLRLQGLQTGAATDLVVTSNAGVLKTYGSIGNYVDQTVNLITVTTTDTLMLQKGNVFKKIATKDLNSKSFVTATSSGTSIPNATPTVISFNANKDSLSDWSTNNTFTARKSGVYNVSGNLGVLSSTAWTSDNTFNILAGGTCNAGSVTQILGMTQCKSGYAGNYGCSFGANIFMNAGETFMVKVFQNSGAAILLATPSLISFTIVQL